MSIDTVEEVMLAVDMVLEAIIGTTPGSIDKLISQAANGEIKLSVCHLALYSAVFSVQKNDNVNATQFAELLRLVQIIPEEPEYLGCEERNSWIPTQDQVDNWRRSLPRSTSAEREHLLSV